MSEKYSVSPNGEKFPLPKPDDYKKEFESIKKRVKQERALGREIVVVMGVGFVGAVMAAIVADTVDKKGNRQNLLSYARPSARSFWKIPMLNAEFRRKSRGPRGGPMIARA